MNELNLSTLAPIYPEVLQPLSWGVLWWILGSVLVLMGMGVWFWHRGKAASDTPDAIMELGKLDFEIHPTENLYRFSLLMQSLPKEQQPRNLPELLNTIEPYKYTSDPPPLPDELKVMLIEAIREVAV